MRHLLIASHAHFASGIRETLELLCDLNEVDITVLCAFVDARNDITAEAETALEGFPESDEVIVCTDVLGGSVNTQFLNIAQMRPGVHVIANMNLPLLISLAFSLHEDDLTAAIKRVVASDEVRVKYCNQEIADSVDEDEDF